MKRISFVEYMDSKKKMKKPVVDITADQLDVRNPPSAMPKPSKGRYKPGVIQPKTAKGGDWGRLGQKELVYKPSVTGKGDCKTVKIPTAEQIQHADFVNSLIHHDPSMLEVLVRQMKKSGLFGALVAEVFEHRESHNHLAEMLTNGDYGPRLMKSLTSAMNEEVAKPFADQLDGGEGDEEEGGDDQFEDEDDEDGELDDDDENIGNGDVEGQDDDLQVGLEGDPAAIGQDPNAQIDPNTGMPMDPNMMGQDPNMMGQDPNMLMQGGQPPMPMGGPPMPMGGPPMPMGGPPMPGQPPMPPPNPMQQFQRKMMRAYQRAMMRKQ